MKTGITIRVRLSILSLSVFGIVGCAPPTVIQTPSSAERMIRDHSRIVNPEFDAHGYSDLLPHPIEAVCKDVSKTCTEGVGLAHHYEMGVNSLPILVIYERDTKRVLRRVFSLEDLPLEYRRVQSIEHAKALSNLRDDHFHGYARTRMLGVGKDSGYFVGGLTIGERLLYEGQPSVIKVDGDMSVYSEVFDDELIVDGDLGYQRSRVVALWDGIEVICFARLIEFMGKDGSYRHQVNVISLDDLRPKSLVPKVFYRM